MRFRILWMYLDRVWRTENDESCERFKNKFNKFSINTVFWYIMQGRRKQSKALVKKAATAVTCAPPNPHSHATLPETTSSQSIDTDVYIATPLISKELIKRSTRVRKLKFLGRGINRQWAEPDGSLTWYKGTLVSVCSGKDGDPDAVYKVLYEDEDYTEGSLTFRDLYPRFSVTKIDVTLDVLIYNIENLQLHGSYFDIQDTGAADLLRFNISAVALTYNRFDSPGKRP